MVIWHHLARSFESFDDQKKYWGWLEEKTIQKGGINQQHIGKQNLK